MLRLLLALSLLLVPAAPALAEGGPAVLTVTGKIAKSNRGPLDPFRDQLFDRFTAGFDKAYAFDLADLQALPQHEMTVSFPEWEGASHSFAGPLVAEVLAIAGAEGTRIGFTAFDGYASEFERAVLEKAGFILALSMDGEPLGFGGVGPIWLMVSPDIEPAFPEGEPSTAGLTWGLFHIGVE